MDKKLHVTIQHGQSPLLVRKCAESCTLFHCPFCKPEVFKPAVRTKLLKHLEAHKNRALQYKGYTIYKCNLDCTRRSHFHCCGCLSLFEQKKRFMKHMLNCEGTLKAEIHPVSKDEAEVHHVSKGEAEGHPVPRYNTSYIGESEPADHSCETISDTHLDEDLDHSTSINSAGAATGGTSGAGPAEDLKALYRRFLLKEKTGTKRWLTGH